MIKVGSDFRFQFRKVQLKAGGNIEQLSLILFQFRKVQLKGHRMY